MLHDDKPKLNDTLLEHHGIKGQKWGVRRARPSGDAIIGARISSQNDRAKMKRAATRIYNTKEGTKARKEAEKKHADLKLAYLKNPDRATALRMTNGEKFILTALGITGIGLVPAAGLGAAQYTYRKTVEGRQASGYYDHGYHKNR